MINWCGMNIKIEKTHVGPLLVLVLFSTTCLIPSEVAAYVPNQSSRAWDVNRDGKVDMKDLSVICRALWSNPQSPNWNQAADVDSDGVVSMKDIMFFLQHYGEQYFTLKMSFNTYNAAGVTDSSGYGNDGTVSGAT